MRLCLASPACRALAEVLKYERCSLVQAAAIPVCLGPDDVIAKAKTGTGKTLAFTIPLIEKVPCMMQQPQAGWSHLVVLSLSLAQQCPGCTHQC
jgi:ATP-dependent RNA helicase MSS116